MSDETPNAQPALEVPSTSTGFESAVNSSLPTQPTQTDTPKDIVMSDAPIEQAASSPAPAVYAPSPIPPRTGTPAQGSRAASAHPDPGFTMPTEAPPHGDPTRRYLNTKVTGVLLEGMKQLAKEKPSDPLRVLGEYLIQRSKELEGGS